MRWLVRVLCLAVTLQTLVAAAPSPARAPARPESIARAQQAYLAYCAMCHGPRGAGDGEVAVALRRSGILVPRLDDGTRLARVGREGVLRIVVEGGAHVGRSNVMPEWGGLVGESLANELADYVMTLPQRGPQLAAGATEAYLRSPPGVPAEGRKLYVFHCSACHGPGGKGDGPSGEVLWRKHGVRPRDLTNSRYMRAKSDKDLFQIISLGGAHLGKSVYMPPWANDLGPAEIKSLVAYLREISHTPSRR